MDKVSIRINDLVVGYDSTPVISGLSCEIAGGEFAGIVGPNGSGKTTLLRTIARILKPSEGAVFIDGRSVSSVPARELAREVGVVPQDTLPAFDFTALEIVLMGRSPHLGRFQSEGSKDLAIAERSMVCTGTLDLAHRQFAALSGGERQRVVIARALAQEPKVILLDEPTSHLDLNYQFEIMNLVQRLNKEQGITVIAVLHDLNLAAQYCSKLLMLLKGKIHAFGAPADVLTAENIRKAYGVDVWVRKHPTSGSPYLVAGVNRPVSREEDERFGHCPKIHVICGGGTGAPIFARLLRRGYEVTSGVLNIGDTDQEAADALGIEYISAPPFTSIPDDIAAKNTEIALGADVIIVSDMPYGAWNLANLHTAADLVAQDKKVILMRPETTRQRDFTDGSALDIIESLMEKTINVSTMDELISCVESNINQLHKS